ncbi:hypothetical protein GJ744_008458 [Endocarpon pusillum]|uniref:Fungal N-terminal domain-containing protein n=1 Tax=Endocarpon pusillum TaxID=364733 RepID=A0A8H7AHD1_9EURO|nr:hypothetical protein GJ744_008458 [Endocarpon pusillum]
MAELAGLAASIIGLVGIGCRISTRLNVFGSDFASAGVEIPSISTAVSMFSWILKQAEHSLKATDSVHSFEAIDTVRQITNECELVFNQINKELDKVITKRPDGSMVPSAQQRFKYCFKKVKLNQLLARLESSKTNLILMMQILQIGRIMASISDNTPKREVVEKNETIARERAQACSLVISHYLELKRIYHLPTSTVYEEHEEQNKQIVSPITKEAESARLTLEASPNYSSSSALIQQPIKLSELDTTFNQIQESPKDIFKIAEGVINPLLYRWTRWQEFHPPTLQNFFELDGQPIYPNGFHDKEENLRLHYREETTTDLTKPPSIKAKEENARPRENHALLQPFISGKGSDTEDSYAHRGPRRRAPSRYIIDSSSETTDSEPEPPSPRRKSNGEIVNDKRSQYSPRGPVRPNTTYGAYSGEKRGGLDGRSNRPLVGDPLLTPRSSVSTPRSPEVQRPVVHPAHGQYQHSYTSPSLPLHIPSPPNPYTPYSPSSPNISRQHPPYQAYNQAQHLPQDYAPGYMTPEGHQMAAPPQPRRGSQDVTAARSPTGPSKYPMRNRQSIEDQKKADWSGRKKNVARGAASGGLISGVWDVFDGLDL